MSHELFELFGMLGAGVGLTALFQRALQPLRLRISGGGAGAPRSRHEQAPGVAASHALSAPGPERDLWAASESRR